MNITKLMLGAIIAFVVMVTLAIGISARFSVSNIVSEPYFFVEQFFNQWSPALSAFGTIILAISVFSFIYVSQRHEEREEKQAIHALHDEILWNLNNIITLRFQISEWQKHIQEKHTITPGPFELLDTRVFDDLKSRGQLHLLEDIRMDTIFCYKLIRDYNMDTEFQRNHLKLLSILNDCLDQVIKNLERKFKFLPHYIKEKSENQEYKTEDTGVKRELLKINTLTICVLFLSFAITVLTQPNISHTLRYIAYAYLGAAGIFAIFTLFPKHWTKFLQNRFSAFILYSLAFVAWLWVFLMKWLDGITNPNTTEIEKTIISYVGMFFLIIVLIIETSMLINVKDRQRWWWLGFLMPAILTYFAIDSFIHNNLAGGIFMSALTILLLITVFSRKKWNPSGEIPYFPSASV